MGLEHHNMTRPLNALIVEDSQNDADFVLAQLLRANFDPQWKRVETEADFLAEIKKLPDIILSDYSMPGFDGLRAAELLRKSGLDIPFILISGTVGEEIAVEAMRRGATDYLLKDRIARLGAAVERALEQKRLRDERKRSEETLQLLRDQSASILNSVCEGVHGIGIDGRIIFENPSAASMLGYEIADLIGQPAHSTIHHTRHDSTPYPQSECPIYATLKDGLSHRVTDELFWRRDGTSFPVEFTTTPLRDSEGVVTGATVVFTDITDRKRAVGELRESERRFTDMLRNLELISMMLDRDARITWCNDYLLRLTGWRREEVIGEDWFERFVPPEILERLRGIHSDLIADRPEAWHYENEILSRSGERRLIAWNNSVLRSPSGEVIGTASIGEDITERKRAAEQQTKQAALLDQTQDAITVRNLEGRLQFWNKGAEKMFGWTSSEAVGRTVFELLKENIPDIEGAMDAMLRKGEWAGELQKVARDGRKLTIDARWTLVRNSEGEPDTILAINTDVTEKKLIEAQFLRAQRMENIGSLAGGVAHDLNNILAPIMMAIEMLKETAGDPQSRSMLEIIEGSARRGADIVRQILSFARGLEGRRVEVQPKHLLKEIDSIIKSTFPKNIRCQLSAPHDTWTILGDPTLLHQILLNLCVNARDAMPDGGLLTIGVENRTIDEQYVAMNLRAKTGPHIVISVTDSGTGMPPDVIEKIFDPFFTTKEPGKGTGLGLSTVMGIVKSHEGFINVYSEAGRGTTFRVHLPAVTSTHPGSELEAQASLPRGNGETVLVIDDEISILTITSQTLQAFGYHVLTANNGATGVAMYVQHQSEIALVLTDMMMPVMDGRATIHALKQINPAVKIIAASGLGVNEEVSKGAALGVRHFLPKPYTAETLLITLRTVLDDA